MACSMKRQELIHIHALLFEVGEYLTEDESIPEDVFAHYKTQPIRPQDIHRNKDAHATAVKHLSSHCSQLVDDSQQQTQTSTSETPST
jgi:hypothetical protein